MAIKDLKLLRGNGSVPMALERGINEIGIFFLVFGILQLFWVIPMMRSWGRGEVAREEKDEEDLLNDCTR